MNLLPVRYDTTLVGASMVIATFASFVALSLARRMQERDFRTAIEWWLGGSIAMGTGIWAMHFIGMLAFTLPIEVGYSKPLTLLSWLAAVAVSGVALAITSRGALTRWRLAGGALLMGSGIGAMHYIGMAAMEMAPGIVWDAQGVAASMAIAVAASAVALAIFEAAGRRRGLAPQWLAAVVMALAIGGMHYTGMAAAGFVAGSVCGAAGSLQGSGMAVLVTLAVLGLLALTLFTSMLDNRMRSREAQFALRLQHANARLQVANEELRRQATLDPLTQLSNRKQIEDRLAWTPALGGSGSRYAVLFIDLDGFKPVNDLFGHACGDQLLIEAARRLRAQARTDDLVARIGGDNFLLLLEGIPGAGDCAQQATRIAQALSRPYDLGGRSFEISCSIGIAIHPDDGPADKLLARADAAMYAAKRAGGNGHRRFEPALENPGTAEQLGLLADLRHAVADGAFELHYQPKIDVASREIRGVEALLRWNHAGRGAIGPAVFVPLAEKSGLIHPLGAWVIEEACRQMREWADAGTAMRVAVNLSVHQLRDERLVGRVAESLARHRIDPAHLLCEITESVAMEDTPASQRTLAALARLGVFLSIDDFGTGYSSLSYLRRLPARQLKIDRSFVGDLETSADARAIVDAVVRLAHAMGLTVVAEGVETAGQRDMLCALGCDELQGYLYARPMAPAPLLRWCEEARRLRAAGAAPALATAAGSGA
ncbi:MAG: EAL domain-containing protein [Burkholderiales bacterium]|nr:EAL domain-containing protein [Burkholderiales bacterium]